MAFGPSWDAIWSQPYHRTLLQFFGLRDHERVRALERKADRIAGAYLVNAAVLDTKRLQAEQRAFLAELRVGVTDMSDRPTADELAAEMMRLGARLNRQVS